MMRTEHPETQELADGFSGPDPRERNEPVTGGAGLRRLARWANRFCSAMLAELKLIDCGSLDVLLFCPDDLSVSAPIETERVH
jgi:hypothetical protein